MSRSIADFAAGPRLLRLAASGMTVEQLKARPIPGRWSALEVVCHLVDSEQIWCHRMKRVIGEDRPLLIGYDESRLAAALGYQNRDVEAELALFEATRSQMVAILSEVDASAWRRSGVHSERGLVTLEEMVQIETEHVIHHVRHVSEKRQALGLPPIALA
ncbi:MAG: DinB family protein [Isosphaeraceae bacterium]